jgi:hypothetical protein
MPLPLRCTGGSHPLFSWISFNSDEGLDHSPLVRIARVFGLSVCLLLQKPSPKCTQSWHRCPPSLPSSSSLFQVVLWSIIIMGVTECRVTEAVKSTEPAMKQHYWVTFQRAVSQDVRDLPVFFSNIYYIPRNLNTHTRCLMLYCAMNETTWLIPR